MNLFDMVRRKDPNLQVSGAVAMAKKVYRDDIWRGISLEPGASFTLADIRRFVNFRHFPGHCGWMVDAPHGSELIVTITGKDGQVLGERRFAGGFQPIFLPWPHGIQEELGITVAAAGKGKEPTFIANHRALSRQWLYDLCLGKGVEIGPGPQPQILAGEGRQVSYLEQMPPEEWNRLYNGGGKYAVRPDLWENYIVGEASSLPVPDGSLDFIFGSHVFEHLANPIGHLKRWREKLAPGGKVVMVVPDLHGTKDAVQCRSTLAEWIEEDRSDIWLPTVEHYSRHLRREPGDKVVVAQMARMESIHVHYYDNINAQILLDFAVRNLGYRDYVIEHTPNHKDFHFVLQNN